MRDIREGAEEGYADAPAEEVVAERQYYPAHVGVQLVPVPAGVDVVIRC